MSEVKNVVGVFLLFLPVILLLVVILFAIISWRKP